MISKKCCGSCSPVISKIPGAIIDKRVANAKADWSDREGKLVLRFSSFFEFASPSVQKNSGSQISETDNHDKIAEAVLQTITEEGIVIEGDGYAFCGDYTLDFN